MLYTMSKIDRNNSHSGEADESWRRINPKAPRVSDNMPTLNSSAQYQFSRPISHAASFDSLFQISTDADDSKTSVNAIASHQPEQGRASVAAADNRESEDNERIAENKVPELETVATIGEAAACDADRPSSPPPIPPPPPPNVSPSEILLDENARSQTTGENTTTVCDLVASPVTKHSGDLFEDIGDAVVSPSFDGESTMTPRSGFRKPRPPAVRRSRITRSPSPDTTNAGATTATAAQVTENSSQLYQVPVIAESRVDPVSTANEEAHARRRSFDEDRLSSVNSSDQISSNATLNDDHYTADRSELLLDVHRDSFAHVSECNRDNNSYQTSENEYNLQPYRHDGSDNVKPTATTHSDSDEALPSLSRQFTDDSGTLDSGYLTPIDGLLISFDDVRHNASEEHSMGDVEHSERINHRLGPNNDTNKELIEEVLASNVDEKKSTEVLGRAPIIGVDGSVERQLLTMQPTVAAGCARVSATESAIGNQTVKENVTCADCNINGSSSSEFGEINASSVASTDDEYVTADEVMNIASRSNLDQVEIFDDDNEPATTAMDNGGLDEENFRVERIDGSTTTEHRNNAMSGPETHIVENRYQILDFVLNKDCVGIGFCIEGGGIDAGSHRNPITIKRMFKGKCCCFVLFLLNAVFIIYIGLILI